MKKLSKTMGICVAALTLAGVSGAAASAEDTLEIRDFIGTINWSNGPMSAEIEKNAGDTKVTGRQSLLIDGGYAKIDGDDCQSSYGRYDIDWFGKNKKGNFGGYENLEDYPVLNISMPAESKLILDNVVVFTAGEPSLAEADLNLRYCSEVSLGDVDGLFALDNRGSADVSVGTTGLLVANLKGSGDLTGADSGDVLIKSHGSADVDLLNVSSLEASIHGSGDITVENIGGAAELSSHGSGDTELGDVTGSLTYAGFGSGDLDASSVLGEKLDLETFGSGDIDIGTGQVDELFATVRGSGTIDYSGVAGTAKLKAGGSGDIYVNRVTGNADIKSNGSGEIDIDERD